jgi:hypothetical protein
MFHVSIPYNIKGWQLDPITYSGFHFLLSPSLELQSHHDFLSKKLVGPVEPTGLHGPSSLVERVQGSRQERWTPPPLKLSVVPALVDALHHARAEAEADLLA